jgi:endonuclease/exonuclease/phosphatase family metal-dependent hydrolase
MVYIVGLSSFMLSALLVFASITDFEPAEREELVLHAPTHASIADKKVFNLLSWNIGYAGLGREMDFFYDGGKSVRPSKKFNMRYFEGIASCLLQSDNMDFIFLQEVDLNAGRSYRQNQFSMLSARLEGYNGVCAVNYDVKFVPVPFSNPMGKVVSGLVNFSRYDPVTSERYSFPGNYDWPKNLFMLDRCFVLQRYQTPGNFELVLINTHNSAFDDGSLRFAQITMLKNIALEEFEKGNFVIIGGDWNLTPPTFKPEKHMSGYLSDSTAVEDILDEYMPPLWKWAFDPRFPTNRSLDKPFTMFESATTIIDFFLVSPNIRVKSVKALDYGFENSDHNPVILSFEIF